MDVAKGAVSASACCCAPDAKACEEGPCPTSCCQTSVCTALAERSQLHAGCFQCKGFQETQSDAFYFSIECRAEQDTLYKDEAKQHAP